MQVSFHIAEAVRKGGFCLHKEKGGGVTATVYVTKDFGFLRGEIYYADLDPHYGSEQGGKRPVIVIQNNTGNKFAPTVIVAAVTSKVTKKPNQPTHVLIDRNPAFSRPSMNITQRMYFGQFPLDKDRDRRIVFYGRVSTQHEAQVDALGNQMQWYDDQLRYHPNWQVVDRYIDEGITGTSAKKRPAFMKMLSDAKCGKFNLIVTREVCRFARNTVDTLQLTRELRNFGVEVFFVSDNIWTMDGDGELRLSIMATMAQEESRKISERVLAGQKISRQNGVLYGSGNIIGYDRDKVNRTYVINEEQAATIRMVFTLYSQGYGEKAIVNELSRLGRKDGHGNVSWSCTKISRNISPRSQTLRTKADTSELRHSMFVCNHSFP